MNALFQFHSKWGYVAIALNALAGVYALVAYQWRRFRSKWVWWVTVAAEIAIMLQVAVGAALVASKDYEAPRFHMFYGFVAFITVGLAYSYRGAMRGRRELLYGFVGLFLMGVGIRAVLQVG